MSGRYFNFDRLVKKYSRPVTLNIRQKGSYSGGIYHEGEEETVVIAGAVISMKMQSGNNSGGNYSAEDKHLYTLSPIPHALENVTVEFDGKMYTATVDRDSGNEPFTGVYVYYLKWIKPFDSEVNRDACTT
jgi:hypothetical protein